MTIKKYHLPMLAARLHCLNVNGEAISKATGFFVQQNAKLSLYTCWHVVTGIERIDPLEYSRLEPMKQRITLRICAQEAKPMTDTSGLPIGQLIGGSQNIDLPLYDEHMTPVWQQDKQDVPDHDLNSIGIRVPYWHDAVSIPLPDLLPLSESQFIAQEDCFRHTEVIGPNLFRGRSFMLGDRVYIVGYPYGYSSAGASKPEAIVLIRHIAATRLASARGNQILLDGAAAPGMSGSPVFVETATGLELVGIYAHMIFPDNPGGNAEKTTAMGVVYELTHSWETIPFVAQHAIGCTD